MPFTLIAWGEEHITSALTSVLNACTPLFTAAFAAWLLHQRLRPPQIAGLVIALGGVAILAGLGGGDLVGSSLLGTLAVVTGTAGYGFGFAYANRFASQLTPMLPVAGLDAASGSLHLRWLGLLCLVLLGAVGTGYAYLLNYRTLQESGAIVASLVTYLIPIVGVAAGVLVLDEPFSYRLVLGGAIVVLGIALTQGRLLGPASRWSRWRRWRRWSRWAGGAVEAPAEAPAVTQAAPGAVPATQSSDHQPAPRD
jgi:drug/metabolite transporter (DMT)-like permease